MKWRMILAVVNAIYAIKAWKKFQNSTGFEPVTSRKFPAEDFGELPVDIRKENKIIGLNLHSKRTFLACFTVLFTLGSYLYGKARYKLQLSLLCISLPLHLQICRVCI